MEDKSLTLDTTYMELLLAHQPVKPNTREEWAEMTALLDTLAATEFAHGPEMAHYVENLTKAILEYEEECEPGPEDSPLSVLRLLMESHGVQSSDLVPAVGSGTYVDRILRGQCPIGRVAAERLGQYFHVSPHCFS
jgi:antitoxin component HigA of HigAB toxin-antitoxin module